MNIEALFLFLILLLGLLLCSFLGGNCNKEGFDSSSNSIIYYGPNGDTATIVDNNDGTKSIQLTQTSGSSNVIFTQSASNPNSFTNPFGFSAAIVNGLNGNSSIVFTLPNGSTQTFTSSSSNSNTNTSNQNSNYSASSYDNYNHFNGSSSPITNGTTYYGPNGATATIKTNSDGSQSIELLQASGSQNVIFTQSASRPTTFTNPFGFSAAIVTGSNGQTTIVFTLPNGTTQTFTQSQTTSNINSNTVSSTQYYGSTGTPIQEAQYALAYQGNANAGAVTGPYGNTAYYMQGPYGNTVAGTTNQLYYQQPPYYGPYGSNVNAGAATGPAGNTAYYAEGPYGNTVAGVSNNGVNPSDYYSSMPPGIPASQIPPGQEDLYILKSEIVPPVCPACPTSSACPRQEKCPPCPACARCPEPSFECKKVPNYNSINEEYLPQPIVNDFSTFGM